MYKVYLLLLFCSSGLSVRVVCWSRLALVCGDVLVYIGSFATDHLFAKDSKNDDLFKRALAHFSSVTRMHDSEFVSGLG